MNKFTTTQEFKSWRQEISGSIGFVPTLGALHDGHLSLVEKSLQHCDLTIVSIYLNPTQFSPDEDLRSYPNTLEMDLKKLAELSVNTVFLPSNSEMYPFGFTTYVNESYLSKTLEGISRQEHFKGVATIVAKLLNIIQPRQVFFGEKDAQQLRIIQKMVQDLNFPVEIVSCPTIREKSGLAMSSRNANLSPEELKSAAIINKALIEGENLLQSGEKDADVIRNSISKIISNESRISVDYVSVADSSTLREISSKIIDTVLVSVAVYLGNTRLIDNFTYPSSSSK